MVRMFLTLLLTTALFGSSSCQSCADNCDSSCQCDNSLLDISYPDVTSLNCNDVIEPSQACHAPGVTWSDDDDDDLKFLLVMVDPDAPSCESASSRYYVHWIVADISGHDLAEGNVDGNLIMEYAGPSPPKNTGYHRYWFSLFNQPSSKLKQLPSDRGSWDYDKFVQRNALQLVASFQFRAQNDG